MRRGTNKNAAPVRRLLMGLEKPKFLAQNCAKNVTDNFLKKKKTTQILKHPTFSHRNSHHNKKKCRISGTLSFSGGDGGSRTRVQTGISNAYYSLSGVVFRKEKDTSEIHPSYPLE